MAVLSDTFRSTSTEFILQLLSQACGSALWTTTELWSLLRQQQELIPSYTSYIVWLSFKVRKIEQLMKKIFHFTIFPFNFFLSNDMKQKMSECLNYWKTVRGVAFLHDTILNKIYLDQPLQCNQRKVQVVYSWARPPAYDPKIQDIQTLYSFTVTVKQRIYEHHRFAARQSST